MQNPRKETNGVQDIRAEWWVVAKVLRQAVTPGPLRMLARKRRKID